MICIFTKDLNVCLLLRFTNFLQMMIEADVTKYVDVVVLKKQQNTKIGHFIYIEINGYL